MSLRYFDAHNHLQDEWLQPSRDRVFAELEQAGVRGLVVNGTSEADWGNVEQLCARPNSAVSLHASYGLHPWDVGNRTPGWEKALQVRLESNPRAGVGEIGLDRWILDRAKPDDARLAGLRRAPLDEQVEVFRRQLVLAAEGNRPTSIHCLDAFGPLHDVLRESPRPRRGFLLHAYAGSTELAVPFVKLGAYFSFNGAFLDPRKHRLRAVYETIPLERLLVETDAPAMPLPAGRVRHSLPAAPGGQAVNHPANVVAAYAGLAEWRGISVEELTAQVERNFDELFGS
jgi:TatD DNase family protein